MWREKEQGDAVGRHSISGPFSHLWGPKQRPRHRPSRAAPARSSLRVPSAPSDEPTVGRGGAPIGVKAEFKK